MNICLRIIFNVVNRTKILSYFGGIFALEMLMKQKERLKQLPGKKNTCSR